MKKKFKFSLDLNKETVSELTKKQQRTIFGGETDACGPNSAGCPEETAPTRTCDCPPPISDVGNCIFTRNPGYDGCLVWTVGTECTTSG